MKFNQRRKSMKKLALISLISCLAIAHAETKSMQTFNRMCAEAKTLKQKQAYCGLVEKQKRAEEIFKQFESRKKEKS
jgi:hypothetical protein